MIVRSSQSKRDYRFSNEHQSDRISLDSRKAIANFSKTDRSREK